MTLHVSETLMDGLFSKLQIIVLSKAISLKDFKALKINFNISVFFYINVTQQPVRWNHLKMKTQKLNFMSTHLGGMGVRWGEGIN